MGDEQLSGPSNHELMRNSSLYREFKAEREEILRHKWLESEKAGRDIGFERALTEWIVKYRSGWRRSRVDMHLLEKIGKYGLSIQAYADRDDFLAGKLLSEKDFKGNGLYRLIGCYVLHDNSALRRVDTLGTTPLGGGVFAREYSDASPVHVHFYENSEIVINREGRIVKVGNTTLC